MRSGFLKGGRDTIRLHLFALGFFGVLAPSLMTGFFLAQAIQSNQQRLAAIHSGTSHETRLDLLRKTRGFGPVAVSHALARLRPGYSRAGLITNVALSSERQVALSSEGSVLSLGDGGRYVGLDGRSIDGMSREELLRDLHEFGKRYMDRNR